MFPKLISIDTTYGAKAEYRHFMVGAGTDNTSMHINCAHACMPSECVWVWYIPMKSPFLYCLVRLLFPRSKQINTDCDRKMYEPLNKLSLDNINPWYGFKHFMCTYIMATSVIEHKHEWFRTGEEYDAAETNYWPYNFWFRKKLAVSCLTTTLKVAMIGLSVASL
jgi:hypothetical protein